MTTNDPLESKVEARLCAAVKIRGGHAYKFTSPAHRGVPDRLVVLPNYPLIFVEVKRISGKLTPLQEVECKKLADMKQAVFVIYGYPDVDAFLDYLDGRPTYLKPFGG